MTEHDLKGVGCFLHQLGLVFPDIILLVLTPVICHPDIPQQKVVKVELQHQLLLTDADVAGVLLGALLLPLVIGQTEGGGGSN